MSLTSFARTVDALLQTNYGVTLHDFIAKRRERGASFGEIAGDLQRLTNGTVTVTRTTIANWASAVLEKAS